MHPAFYFIRYLLTTGSKVAEDNQWVQKTLGDLELFPAQATTEIIDKIRAELKPPANYQPASRTHTPSIKYQQELKVRDMHVMSPWCKAACEIRNDSAAREYVESLLLAYTPFPQVARQLNKKCRTRYTVDAISLFFHYFFNVEKVPRTFWVDATRRRVGSSYFKAALVGKPELVLWKMGEDLLVETREALEEAFTQAYMRLVEMRGMPTNMATMKMFQMGVDSLVRIFQAMSDSEIRMKDVMKQLEQFQQTKKEIEIPAAQVLGEISANMKSSDQEKLLPPAFTDYEDCDA